MIQGNFRFCGRADGCFASYSPNLRDPCIFPLPRDTNTEEGDEQSGLVGADDKAIHVGGHAANSVQTAIADIRTRKLGMSNVGTAQVAPTKNVPGQISMIEVRIRQIALLKDAVL